jgi:putative hydrolase of the HAD superfamily
VGEPSISLNSIRGIVLDAVGTLIEPRPSVAEVYASAAKRQDVDLDIAVTRSRFRQLFATLESGEPDNPFATDEPNERRRWRAIVAGCLPEVLDPDRAFEELWDHFGNPTSWRVFPDVDSALARLREAGIPFCVASNFDGRLHQVFAGLSIGNHLKSISVVSSEVGYRKPHPAFYLAAFKRLSVDRSEVLFVGDDPENDFHGPRRNGFHAVLVERALVTATYRDLGMLVDAIVAVGAGN